MARIAPIARAIGGENQGVRHKAMATRKRPIRAAAAAEEGGRSVEIAASISKLHEGRFRVQGLGFRVFYSTLNPTP
jgi:hypothetical protein